MGFFDKIKDAINKAKEASNQKQEEEKRRQEEATRFNPKDKSLEWFGSEDGIQTFHEYIVAQNYLLEETIKKEHEATGSGLSLETFISLSYYRAKLPSAYFRNLVDAIDAPVLEYVGPTKLVVSYLSMQAKPFYIDDDGEPQSIVPELTPEEIVSVQKNPVLNYAKNFNCFELADDVQGSFDDKWDLWAHILEWLCLQGSNKDIIAQNPWIFSKEVYFNELGTIRKQKGFYKKCIELAADEESKAFFEEQYNECE